MFLNIKHVRNSSSLSLNLMANLQHPLDINFGYVANQVENFHTLFNYNLQKFSKGSSHFTQRNLSFKLQPTFCYALMNDYLNNMNKLPQTNQNTIYSSSYRDYFIATYHSAIHAKNLISYSDDNIYQISKQTYEDLKSLSSSSYIFGSKSNIITTECFIDDHTYFKLSKNIQKNIYELLTYFTSNQEIESKFQAINVIQPSSKIEWCTGLNNYGELAIDTLTLEPLEIMDNSFYPWLNGIHLDDYIDNFINSSENILLLYSQMGQGKSNFLKYLLYKTGKSALITYQDSVRDLDILFSTFINGETTFLIIEDADEFLIKREQGNSAMKRLLNVADGLTSSKNKKLIFTTNLTNLNHIDPALLRPGRCFDKVEFKAYTPEQAEDVAKVLNIDLKLDKPTYTLAELFSIRNNKLNRNIKTSTPSFGFSS